MDKTRQAKGRGARSIAEAARGEGMPRREALKSLVAGLAAVPLGAEGFASGGQPLAAGKERPRAENARDQLFDRGWRFHRGDVPGGEQPEFDDSSWRPLDLPHDWSVEALLPLPEASGAGSIWGDTVVPARVGPFDVYASEGKRDTAWVVGGTGWYRKRFNAHPGPDAQVAILFEGVYMSSDVWLNGHHLGFHPYGYTSFAYDLTPYLDAGGKNVLAVRVRNEGRNSRWYSGSGIYRHVWLNVTGKVRVPLWGVYVSTPEVSQEAATVKVAVKVENRGKAAQDVAVRVRLFDSKNAVAGERQATHQVEAGGSAEVAQEFTVPTPHLWTPRDPRLCRAEVDLLVDGKPADHTATTFGIRKIEVDAERGLRINGEAFKLRGGCLHHDNGLLGAAAIDRAEERRVELMKANGFNAIRSSHNPPSPAFLAACDRLGVMVIDEAFDQWEKPKNPQDYHLYFKDWWQSDIDSMVLRDRNHPSVIFWSIGNEIAERAEPSGIAIARQLIAEIRRHDATRPITEAIVFSFASGGRRPWGEESDPAYQLLEVGGYNYLWPEYEKDHARVPSRVMMGTESMAQVAFQNWREVEKNSYVIGDFVWTGMDYLGESGIGNAQLNQQGRFGQEVAAPAIPGAPAELGGVPLASFALSFAGYPWFNAYCGDIDMIGEPKPQMYYKRVVWGMSKLEMAVERPVPEGRKEQISAWGWSDELRSWSWPGYEGTTLKVRVYSSGDQVRLLLNGREIAVKPVSEETKLRAEFDVPYAPGELKAIALSGGSPIAELAFRTAQKPAALRLKADRASIRLDPNDLAYVTLEVVDKAGEVVPDATLPVSFSLAGAGELVAAGSANPKDVLSFRQRRVLTFHGKCLAIVKPAGSAGGATLRAQAEGLAPASVTIKIGQ